MQGGGVNGDRDNLDERHGPTRVLFGRNSDSLACREIACRNPWEDRCNVERETEMRCHSRITIGVRRVISSFGMLWCSNADSYGETRRGLRYESMTWQIADPQFVSAGQNCAIFGAYMGLVGAIVRGLDCIEYESRNTSEEITFQDLWNPSCIETGGFAASYEVIQLVRSASRLQAFDPPEIGSRHSNCSNKDIIPRHKRIL